MKTSIILLVLFILPIGVQVRGDITYDLSYDTLKMRNMFRPWDSVIIIEDIMMVGKYTIDNISLTKLNVKCCDTTYPIDHWEPVTEKNLLGIDSARAGVHDAKTLDTLNWIPIRPERHIECHPCEDKRFRPLSSPLRLHINPFIGQDD